MTNCIKVWLELVFFVAFFVFHSDLLVLNVLVVFIVFNSFKVPFILILFVINSVLFVWCYCPRLAVGALDC